MNLDELAQPKQTPQPAQVPQPSEIPSFFCVMMGTLDHRKDFPCGRLVGQHLAKSLDEGAQSLLWHFRYQPVVHAALTEQRMSAILDCVCFQQPVEAQTLACGAQQGH